MKSFEVFYNFRLVVFNVRFRYYNDLIKLLSSFFVILGCWQSKNTICLVSFFSFYELFPAFICANSAGSLVNSLFEVKIFTPFPSFPSKHLLVFKTSLRRLQDTFSRRFQGMSSRRLQAVLDRNKMFTGDICI